MLGVVPDGNRVVCDDAAWQRVVLPHCWNACDTFLPVRGYYRGKGWYRKHFTLSEKDCAGKVFIEFGAGFAVAEVWVNEDNAGRFMGGFTGFAVDATPYVDPGENAIAVLLDNSHDPDVLPGKEIPDYNLYGGLYREAALVIKDGLHMPQYATALLTPIVTSTAATVQAGVAVRNDRPGIAEFTCTVSIADADGRLVMERREPHRLEAGGERVIAFHFPAIRSPMLWSPDAPYLYTVTSSIEQDKTVIDAETHSLGLRTFEFTREHGFLLNGKPVKLRGVNRHQDYPGLGNALPKRLQSRDAEIIKEMGGNFVRTSHYPQHPAFLDACDRLGILVYEEIASWQFIGGERFMRNAEIMMRQMIARDKNHPAIILWGLLNEGRDRDFFGRLNAAAHRADPTRPTAYAENQPEEGKQLSTVFVPDVLGINYRLDDIDHIRALLSDLRLFSSEHTNADFAVRGDLDKEMAQLERIRHDIHIIDRREYLAGGALWSMHDYGTDYEPVWPCQHSGVLDPCRLPKQAFYYLRCHWRREPMLHICGHWTWPGQEGQARAVCVLHNCDSVELFLDGEPCGKPIKKNLAHWEVVYRPGTLAAVGVKNGKKGKQTVRTAGPASAVALDVQPKTISADGSDVAEVTIWIVDARGTVVPCEGEVLLRLEGPADLRGIGGKPAAPIAAGEGRIIVQAQTTPGEVRIRARYDELPEAEAKLVIE